MVVGLSLWHVVFSSNNLTFVDIKGISLFTTLFKWLFEGAFEKIESRTS